MPDPKYQKYIQTRKSIDQFYHRLAAERALPDSVMFLCYAICETGEGRTPSELYAETALSKQTGHSALMWLEKRGLVELIPSPEDRRSKRVVWTPAGRVFAGETMAPLLSAEAVAFGGLTGSEQETLIALTDKMFQSLKKEVERLFPSGKGD